MKKLISVFLVFGVLFGFASCKKQEEEKREEIIEDAKEIVSEYEATHTRKDPEIVENLTDGQKEYFDALNEIDEESEFVAYIDTPNYTLVYTCEFKDNVVSKVMSYHIIKNDAYFNAIKAGIDERSPATVDDENKVIKADKTDEYKSKSYDEMIREFSQYSIVE